MKFRLSGHQKLVNSLNIFEFIWKPGKNGSNKRFSLQEAQLVIYIYIFWFKAYTTKASQVAQNFPTTFMKQKKNQTFFLKLVSVLCLIRHNRQQLSPKNEQQLEQVSFKKKCCQ